MILKIRQERLMKKWTQSYVAEKIGLTKTAIHDIETGKQRPSFEVLVKLLVLFNKKTAAKQIRELFAAADETSNLS